MPDNKSSNINENEGEEEDAASLPFTAYPSFALNRVPFPIGISLWFLCILAFLKVVDFRGVALIYAIKIILRIVIALVD
jgi:hypothetical protein